MDCNRQRYPHRSRRCCVMNEAKWRRFEFSSLPPTAPANTLSPKLAHHHHHHHRLPAPAASCLPPHHPWAPTGQAVWHAPASSVVAVLPINHLAFTQRWLKGSSGFRGRCSHHLLPCCCAEPLSLSLSALFSHPAITQPSAEPLHSQHG